MNYDLEDTVNKKMLEASAFEQIVSEFEVLTKEPISEKRVLSFLKSHSNLPEQVYDLFLGKYWLDLREYDVNNLKRAKYHLDTYLESIRGLVIEGLPDETYLSQAISNAYSFGGLLYSIMGDKELALWYYKNHQYINVQWGVSFEDIVGVQLYSFRRFNQYSLSDLINSEITVCSPRIMNDPFDSIYSLWVEHFDELCKEKKHIEPFKRSFDYYRIRAFVKDTLKNHPYDNILMWSHYADEHRGFCIEYQFSNAFCFSGLDNKIAMRFHPIHYTDEAVVINNSLKSDLGFHTKQKRWQYENEERLLTYIPEIEGDFAQIPLDTGSSIKAIYFGFRCPQKDRETIMHILGNNVHYYQMKHSLSDVYKLSPEQIG